MSHCLMGMPMMQDPTKSFGQIICWIQDTSNVLHKNVTLPMPFLYRKELNIYVSGACGGFALIDHSNCCLVIFIENHRTFLSESEILQHRTQVSGYLGCMYCCNKLCLIELVAMTVCNFNL